MTPGERLERAAKYAVRERERRFLLAGAPVDPPAGPLIEDTYLPGTGLRLRRVTAPDGTVVRKLGHKVRERGPAAVLHTSLYLDDAEWRALDRGGHRLVKRRFLLRDAPEDLVVAVDVFEGALAGLVTAEIDLGDGPDVDGLEGRLAALGLAVRREVTGEEEFTGGALAARAAAAEAAPTVAPGGPSRDPAARATGTQDAVRVRPYRDDDWPEIAALLRAVLAEGETYTGDPAMPEGELRSSWLADEHTVVAEADGTFLGTAHMGPNRPFNGGHVGTASFLVAPAARGRGVGRALGEYAVGWHRRNGFRAIQFNAVVETNVVAVRLWRSLGFEVVGTVPGAFRRRDGEYVGLHVMHLDLAD